MVVRLEATTVKLVASRNRTDTLKGWTSIIGAGPRAEQGRAIMRHEKNRQIAAFFARQLNFAILRNSDIQRALSYFYASV
jgi:hypothetical protein